MENVDHPKEEEHHKQLELCKTRPAYRQGRKLTAVKVYTIASESQHLFIYGVPKINLRNELKKMCTNYGQVLSIHVVTNYKCEIFTECYHVQYQRIQSARIAKRFIDNKSFYGGILHVCYAPEFESVEETRIKLFQRTKDVMNRLHPKINNIEENSISESSKNTTESFKRKHYLCNQEGINDPIMSLHNSQETKTMHAIHTSGIGNMDNIIKRQIPVEIPPHYLKSSDSPSCSNSQFINKQVELIPHQVANTISNSSKKILFRKKAKINI